MKQLILLFLVTGIFACTEDFQELNTNPNQPIEVQPELLLRQVVYDYGEEMSYEGFVAGNLLGQYFAEVDFNLFDRHSLTEPQFGGNPWPSIYTNLRDNELLLQQSRSEAAQAVYEGPALILKAYMAAALTDIYGDVPYSQALRGLDGQVTPVYDAQEEIYTGTDGILENLDAGIAAITAYNGTVPLQGDILFGGDLDGWVRLANSLKIKYLMRASARIDAGPELQRLFAEGVYIQQNEQNATFDFTDGQPNNFRLATLRSGDFNLFVLSETMESILNALDDPRLATFFRPTQNDSDSFNGLLNGQDASATSISVADFSLTGTIFREETGRLDANFMTAWETNFLLAEAAAKGFIDADAQALYEQAVTQAFAYWATPLPATYLTDGVAAFDEENALEQIITQKWIASIINGYEGWIEWRRTGFPALRTVAASLNDDLIPVKMPYPADEPALNAANFEAVTGAAGNTVNARVWWDVE